MMDEVTSAQPVIMKIAAEKTDDEANIFSLMNIVSHSYGSDKMCRPNYKSMRVAWYNPAIMRYERNSNSFSCIGVRGFITEGLSIYAPVA